LSRPDSAGETARLDALGHLPREKDGPVFAEPWEAQAFALAVKLSEQGHFTWSEWAAALGAELKAAAERGDPDDGSHYYEHWLAALERLVTEKGLTDRAALATRKAAWADAYRHTPQQAGGTPCHFFGCQARIGHRRGPDGNKQSIGHDWDERWSRPRGG
jgi:nitrile hydratase accessory protein